MTRPPSKIFGLPSPVLATLHIAFAAITLIACSNSEPMGVDTEENYSVAISDTGTTATEIVSHDTIKEYLPLDDTEYPYAGIPRIVIETENHREIKDQETEILAKLQIWGEKSPESEIMRLSIRGRGNSSWGLPKKSYKIEFIDKQAILGMPKDRDWALIANHLDTTMIRNYIANYISKISNISYTPRNQFVELFLNGKYKGTYQLYETLKISKSRINIGKGNFLLEVDNHPKSKDVSFNVNHISHPIKIHSASITKNDPEYNYVQKEINNIDSLLFSDFFLNEESGYKNYIDIDALAEWYVITEITKNASSINNWYMTYEKNGKLKMGPFWDYDLAFGNTLWGLTANDISGLWMDTIPWFKQFIQDSIFKKKTMVRFSYFYSQKETILDEVNKISQTLKQAIIHNEKLWNLLDCSSCSSNDILKKYDKHVTRMEQWLIQRMDWLKQNIFYEESVHN